jgi:hypothetical protein
MSGPLSEALHAQVRAVAANRCGYCLTHQAYVPWALAEMGGRDGVSKTLRLPSWVKSSMRISTSPASATPGKLR